jgi:hypothetical protein
VADGKGKLLLALAAGPKKPPEAVPDESGEAAMGDGVETAMGELMDALKAGDTKAAAEAFKSAVSMCHYDEG